MDRKNETLKYELIVAKRDRDLMNDCCKTLQKQHIRQMVLLGKTLADVKHKNSELLLRVSELGRAAVKEQVVHYPLSPGVKRPPSLSKSVSIPDQLQYSPDDHSIHHFYSQPKREGHCIRGILDLMIEKDLEISKLEDELRKTKERSEHAIEQTFLGNDLNAVGRTLENCIRPILEDELRKLFKTGSVRDACEKMTVADVSKKSNASKKQLAAAKRKLLRLEEQLNSTVTELELKNMENRKLEKLRIENGKEISSLRHALANLGRTSNHQTEIEKTLREELDALNEKQKFRKRHRWGRKLNCFRRAE